MTDTTLQSIPDEVEANRLIDRLMAHVRADEALVELRAGQTSTVDFARNELLGIEGKTDVRLGLQLSRDGRMARAETHEFSEQGLATLVDQAEYLVSQRIMTSDQDMAPPVETELPKDMWFAAAAERSDPGAHAAEAFGAIARSREAGMISAGSLLHEHGAHLIRSTTGYGGFTRYSYSSFSMSSRTASGTGSGWAWAGGENAALVDAAEIADRAIALARDSEDPVAVEPGRYSVIMEPEAVAQLMEMIIIWPTSYLSAAAAESRGNVFTDLQGGNKVGQQMAEARVQFLYDPHDPLMPITPFHAGGFLRRTHWLRNGMLETLANSAAYAKANDLPVVVNPVRARLEVDGPQQSLEEMISRTRRGIWVRHFSGLNMVDAETLLLSGVTRDGTFLIEDGKISKPIKNLRFTDSPFFILNKLEAAGMPVRSHRQLVTPRLKINDFEFNSLSDAI